MSRGKKVNNYVGIDAIWYNSIDIDCAVSCDLNTYCSNFGKINNMKGLFYRRAYLCTNIFRQLAPLYIM